MPSSWLRSAVSAAHDLPVANDWDWVLQLAGLKVYTTASKHHTHLQALGADVVFDYNGSDEQETVGQKIHKKSEGNIKVSLDGFSHAESIELVAQALSSQGGKIVSIREFSALLMLLWRHLC